MARKPTTSPTTGHRCAECGVHVARGDFEPLNPEPSWRRCETCTHASPGDLVAAALARAGVEGDPAGPAVIVGLRRVPWKARTVEDNRARATAERETRPMPGEFPASRERRLAQVLAGLDTVGPPSAQPWEHLDARAIRRAIAEARGEHDQANRPRRCTDGPCGVCGVRLSLRWWGPQTFGTAAGLSLTRAHRWPVCATCQPILTGAGGNPTSETARRRWTALVLDQSATPPSMSMPASVAPYAVYVGPDLAPTDAPGTVEPWGWVTDADRDALAQRAPQHRPGQVLDRERRIAGAQARLSAGERTRGPRSALVDGEDR
jgi:hypothetical protein